MDAALAMIMANIGRIDKNMFVFDPFVGSGKHKVDFQNTYYFVVTKKCHSVS